MSILNHKGFSAGMLSRLIQSKILSGKTLYESCASDCRQISPLALNKKLWFSDDLRENRS